MLIKLQGGATIIRTSMINEVWVDWGNKIKAKINGEEDSIYLAVYYNHPEKAAAVFREIEKAMQVDSNELLILPDDEGEEADNDDTDVC